MMSKDKHSYIFLCKIEAIVFVIPKYFNLGCSNWAVQLCLSKLFYLGFKV